MTDKKRLNTEWLTGCGGCHVNLVDMHEKILQVISTIEIQRCPLLTDVKTYPKADIGLLTGAIRNDHDAQAAITMREVCDVIVAFGTCAVFGGIPGAGLAHSREEIVDYVFSKSRTTQSGTIPDTHVSPLQKMVTPIDEIIEVDYYLPGCPPHAAFTFDALLALIEQRAPKMTGTTVCGRCDRVMKKSEVDRIKPNHEGIPTRQTCFFSQGYICLGSVTVDRCLAPCPTMGVACTGCAGPTIQICMEPHRDIRTEIAERMSRLTAIPYQDIVLFMERSAKTHYAYAMATKMIGDKPTFLINKWIAEVEKVQ